MDQLYSALAGLLFLAILWAVSNLYAMRPRRSPAADAIECGHGCSCCCNVSDVE
jgi:hypothetical protein